MFSTQTYLYAGIFQRLENSYTYIDEPLVEKSYVINGLVYMYFRAVDWNAFIYSQLYSMLFACVLKYLCLHCQLRFVFKES
jgi:hypothetical protein